MYRSNRQQLEFPDFYLPFSGQLDPENRWVKLAKLVPWGLAEEIYHADLCENESVGASDCLKFVQWLSCFLLKSCVLNRLFCWSTWFRSRVKKPL